MPRKEVIRTTINDIRLDLYVPSNFISYRHTWVAKRHCNADHELHIVLHGSCCVDVEGTEHTLHAGQGILILPDKFHNPVSYSSDFDKLVLDLFPASGQLVSDPNASCVVLDFPPATAFLANELLTEHTNPAPFHQKMVHFLLGQLTIHLLRLLGAADTESATAINSDLRVDIIDSFFANCLRENVTKDLLCAQLCLSPSQLHRFLQKRYGMSFREKLISTRMTHAGWLLRNSELSVQQIAHQVGYTSVPAFIRCFSQFHNCSPNRFRARQALSDAAPVNITPARA